jgi:hypothetical protein
MSTPGSSLYSKDQFDRRRLRRDVPWTHPDQGVYATSDLMHGVRKVGPRKWERGVRQPYHLDGQFDFSQAQTFSRLRDAQAHVETEEKARPRILSQRTLYHDRRGF